MACGCYTTGFYAGVTYAVGLVLIWGGVALIYRRLRFP